MSCLPRSYVVPTLAATRAKIPSEHIQLQASARSLWRPRLARCPCLRFAKMLSALLLRLSKRATHRSFSRKEVFIWADSGVFLFPTLQKITQEASLQKLFFFCNRVVLIKSLSREVSTVAAASALRSRTSLSSSKTNFSALLFVLVSPEDTDAMLNNPFSTV